MSGTDVQILKSKEFYFKNPLKLYIFKKKYMYMAFKYINNERAYKLEGKILNFVRFPITSDFK